MSARQRMGDKVEVGGLEESMNGRRFVLLSSHPAAHFAEFGGYRSIGLAEQMAAVVASPLCQLVCAGVDLVGYLVDAEYTPLRIAVEQPLLECRAEIQTIMQVFCLNEDIGIQQITHAITPNSRAVS